MTHYPPLKPIEWGTNTTLSKRATIISYIIFVLFLVAVLYMLLFTNWPDCQ